MLIKENTFESALQHLRGQPYLAVDTETTGLHSFNGDRICGVSTADRNANTYYFPFRHGQGYNLPESYMAPLIEVLNDPNRTMLFHNAKFDIHMLMREGMNLPMRIEDTQVAAHLLNENEESFALKKLSVKYINPESANEQDFLKELLVKAKLTIGDMWQLSSHDVGIYAEKDAYLTIKLMDFFREHLKIWRLENLFEDVNHFQLLISRMENQGIKMDVEKIKLFEQEALEHAEIMRAKICLLAGYEINPGSPKQLKTWLNLPDTSTDTLDALETDREDINAIKLYRVYKKMASTYYKAYLKFTDQNHILHCNFRVTGTVSGRLSCADPNLQAIPKKSDKETVFTEIRNKVKECFIARPGYVLCEWDYSQAELRKCAHYADEKVMKQAFESGEDLHAATARNMGLNPKTDRNIAKTLNFAVLYGAGPEKIASQMKITPTKAAAYLESYFKTFPGLKNFKGKLEKKTRKQNYIRFFSGRVRRLPKNQEYKALNSLLQGSVAEMVRMAMLRIDAEVKDINMLLQIHDSIICEVPENMIEEKIEEVLKIMEDQPFSVYMEADAKYGKSLGTMVKYERKLK